MFLSQNMTFSYISYMYLAEDRVEFYANEVERFAVKLSYRFLNCPAYQHMESFLIFPTLIWQRIGKNFMHMKCMEKLSLVILQISYTYEI